MHQPLLNSMSENNAAMLREMVSTLARHMRQVYGMREPRARTSRHAQASGGPCCGADLRRDASCSRSCAAMTSASASAPAPLRLPVCLALSSVPASAASGASCSPARPSFAAQPMTSCSVAHSDHGAAVDQHVLVIADRDRRCQVEHASGTPTSWKLSTSCTRGRTTCTDSHSRNRSVHTCAARADFTPQLIRPHMHTIQ